MERLYYVEREHETSETSDRLEAARIAAEWRRRGYKVETIAVDVEGDSVRLAEDTRPERDRGPARRSAGPGPISEVNSGRATRGGLAPQSP